MGPFLRKNSGKIAFGLLVLCAAFGAGAIIVASGGLAAPVFIGLAAAAAITGAGGAAALFVYVNGLKAKARQRDREEREGTLEALAGDAEARGRLTQTQQAAIDARFIAITNALAATNGRVDSLEDKVTANAHTQTRAGLALNGAVAGIREDVGALRTHGMFADIGAANDGVPLDQPARGARRRGVAV